MVLKSLQRIYNNGLLANVNELFGNLLPHTRANSTSDNDCTNRHDLLFFLSSGRPPQKGSFQDIQNRTEEFLCNQYMDGHLLIKKLKKRAIGSAISNIGMLKMGSNIIWKLKGSP